MIDFANRQEIPTIMSIPAPVIVRRPRGKHAAALHSHMDTRFKVLLDTQEKELSKEEAPRLGITNAEFIRHCALQSAKYLQRYREDYYAKQQMEQAEHENVSA